MLLNIFARLASLAVDVFCLLVSALRTHLPRRPGVVGSLVPPPSTLDYRNAQSVGEFYRKWRERNPSNYEVTSTHDTEE